MKERDIFVLQEYSIFKITSAKEKRIVFLQAKIAQISIEEQLVILRIQQKIL